MKTAAALVAWFLVTTGALAQGTVTFTNGWQPAPNQTVVDGPVHDVDGSTPLVGSGFLAELYGAALGNSLQPVPESITAFSTQEPGYFFDPSDVAVPGVAIGGRAVVQVVAWRASDGATFAQAYHPGGHVGTSNVLAVGPLGGGGGVPLPGALLIGLQGFSLHEVVPEPSPLILGLLGVVVLSLLARRPGQASAGIRFSGTDGARSG